MWLLPLLLLLLLSSSLSDPSGAVETRQDEEEDDDDGGEDDEGDDSGLAELQRPAAAGRAALMLLDRRLEGRSRRLQRLEKRTSKKGTCEKKSVVSPGCFLTLTLSLSQY